MILVGILALIFSVYQLIIFMINKNKIEYTDGTIVEVNTAVPETMKKNNSNGTDTAGRLLNLKINTSSSTH